MVRIPAGEILEPAQPARSKLAEIHPALRTANSFAVHQFSTIAGFAKWKAKLTGRVGPHHDGYSDGDEQADQEIRSADFNSGSFAVAGEIQADGLLFSLSSRSAPPLFGLGIIDRIPDRVLEEVALCQSGPGQMLQREAVARQSPEAFLNVSVSLADALKVSGRVSRLKDGRIGRFGWKGQVATLHEFTLQACASELGIEVPGFPQSAPPWIPGFKTPGLDLTAAQCDSLVKFVASFPAPIRRRPESEQHAREITAGQKLFDRIGCAVCHRPTLGDVDGIYSDLLLHDMGQSLSDGSIYGLQVTNESSDRAERLPVFHESLPVTRRVILPKFGASHQEWRLRDSAPYMHDGRARTISVAVAIHGGEGGESARQFFRLTLRERQQIELFLQSLAAPMQ